MKTMGGNLWSILTSFTNVHAEFGLSEFMYSIILGELGAADRLYVDLTSLTWIDCITYLNDDKQW